jgi:hypothetical protein
MIDDQNGDVNIANNAALELVNQEIPSAEQLEAQQVQAQPALDPKAENFRQLRETKERIERERDEYAREIQALKAQFQQPQQIPQEDEDLRIGDTELAEGKHLARLQKQIKELKGQIRQSEERSAAATTEALLKSRYPDFDQVVTKEAIESLKYEHPEIAQALASSPDIYSKAASTYTIIKKMGLQPDPSLYEMNKQAAQKNSLKPKPSASLAPQQGDSPMSKANAFANGLTPELKAQLWKEMESSRRSL